MQTARALKASIDVSTEGEDYYLALWRGQLGSTE